MRRRKSKKKKLKELKECQPVSKKNKLEKTKTKTKKYQFSHTSADNTFVVFGSKCTTKVAVDVSVVDVELSICMRNE